MPSSSDFLYVSKKWFATRSKKLCMFSIVVVFGHSPSLLIHIPKGRPQYVAQQLRSLLPFAVFRILNPTIDARLLLVCYGATPPSRSSACTGRNPSGRGCAQRTHQFKATRRVHPPPSASLPGLPSRTPPMLDALEEASGLDRDLGSSGAEQTTLGERGDGRQEQAGQGPPRRARRPGRQMSRRGNGAMLL